MGALTWGVLIVATVVAIIPNSLSTLYGLTSQSALDNADSAARRAARGETVTQTVPCRSTPLRIAPEAGLQDVVSSDDVATVLCQALPLWHPPSVPSVYHSLKLWGPESDFTEAMVGDLATSGNEWLKIVTNDAACRELTVPVGDSYLLDSPYGIRVVLAGTADAVEYRAEAHYGQLLMLLGEAGVPSTFPVVTESGKEGTVEDVYRDAVLRFSLAHEPEFMACALAYWHAPKKTWRNRLGEEYSFDDVIGTLLDRPFGEGSCGGCHAPYSVVVILRVDEEHGLLSPAMRKRAEDWLRTLCDRLEARQSESGAWGADWGETGMMWRDEVLDRITVTGHHLEWIALAPKHLRPSREAIARAVVSLRSDVEALQPLPYRSFKTLLPVSHAARALALCRGEDPYEAWVAYWNDGRIEKTPRGYRIGSPTD
ncbi:hypothetical protein [Maioricimonas rarisocia]|uniref:hypothetical protein n=1 Tax=Maioricimonas rarisocia TaxID=2528026 RepID=UPI0018D20942|nr:hypothetical protein [Maioricimonas rarisocia]